MKELNLFQKERYDCSTFLKEIGKDGQVKLLNSRVFIVGVGGLGNHILLTLAAMGVGHITIADEDTVKLDNLPRQILYDEKDIGKNKVDVAENKIKDKNPDIKINKLCLMIDENNAKNAFSGYDLVIDATDNFKSKFIIEDACKELGISFICAGVSDFKGQVILVTKESKYSFKSLFDVLPINIEQKYIDEDKGVFPPAVALVANLAANQAAKYLLDIGDLLLDTLIVVDTKKVEIKKYKFE